ncbi:unnamed protein product [Rotaria magnacalcarata]
MFRLNYVVLMFALTILPYGVDGFFSQNVMNITTTRNINCYLRADLTSTSFQFCAIRIYRNQSEIPDIASAVYNGLRYMNTMHQLTQKSCIATVPTSSVDTGAWSCEGKLPYETYTSVDLCICATDNCNQNLTFCQKSVTNTTNMPASTDFMPNLTSIISCNDATKENYTCSAHPYINVSLCQGYVINNTVLCAISTSGTTITQLSLIGENYEVYLSEKIYQANSIPTNATKTSSNETQTNFYFKILGRVNHKWRHYLTQLQQAPQLPQLQLQLQQQRQQQQRQAPQLRLLPQLQLQLQQQRQRQQQQAPQLPQLQLQLQQQRQQQQRQAPQLRLLPQLQLQLQQQRQQQQQQAPQLPQLQLQLQQKRQQQQRQAPQLPQLQLQLQQQQQAPQLLQLQLQLQQQRQPPPPPPPPPPPQQQQQQQQLEQVIILLVAYLAINNLRSYFYI